MRQFWVKTRGVICRNKFACIFEKSEKLGGLPQGKPSNFYDFAAKTANCSVNPYLGTGLLI
jgi:hypothetical protein